MIVRSNGRIIARVYGQSTETEEANARRIVACVNACEGINPEAVPDLLEAAEWLNNFFIHYPHTSIEFHRAIGNGLADLESAIAKAKCQPEAKEESK